VRSTEKTAAASVADVVAPRSTDNSQDNPSSQCAKAATTTTLIVTPTVASEIPTGMAGRTSRHFVVRPPSARITIRAAKPSA
jgi:hypothetical protein